MKDKKKMTFQENYLMRVWLTENYGESKQLDITGVDLAIKLTDHFGFHVYESSIYKACADLEVKPKHKKMTQTKQLKALEARILSLEIRLGAVCVELGLDPNG